MGLASDERQQLCDLFEQVGPEAPRLCDGWNTRDLAVHLVLRDRRPDALAGKFVKALADRREKAEQELRAKPWPELVDEVRQVPPKWHPLRLDQVDQADSSVELYVRPWEIPH